MAAIVGYNESWTADSPRTDINVLLAWVKSSEQRVDILTSLYAAPKNKSDFADEWGVSIEAVHYHLDLLLQGGPTGEYPALVRLVTLDRERYRLYDLPEKGAELVEYL